MILNYLRAVGVLAVRHLDHDLHGAGVLVAEVLHAASDRVPVGPIGNAVSEVWLDETRGILFHNQVNFKSTVPLAYPSSSDG